jgi:L-serine dehydratase
MLDYNSIEELCQAAEQAGKPLSALILEDQAEQMEISAEVLYERMAQNLHIMMDAVHAGMAPGLRSTSGLTGGDAAKMKAYAETGGMTGSFLNKAMARAIAVSEYNAAMGKIVASPTAGSCGILPGTAISMLEEGKCSEEAAVMALFTAGAIGMVIAAKASIAGAQGGCQAECGSASAMAAAALVELSGGTPTQAAHACAMAIKNQLGLVCDPVAGLVEIPCIKRNVSGIAIAFTSAEMALAGIESKIPVDECVMAMRQVGDMLPCALKETSQGGLATTPTGLRLKKQVFGDKHI